MAILLRILLVGAASGPKPHFAARSLRPAPRDGAATSKRRERAAGYTRCSCNLGASHAAAASGHARVLPRRTRCALETIERLRTFGRQTPVAASERADLNRIAHEALEISRSRMRTRPDAAYRVREELGEPGPVRLDAAEGVAALVNLIVNAIDAMPTGGTITLRTGAEADGSWVSIADDGPGMTPEVEQRMFEPFFTTKGEEGTGLGLAMAYATVQRHAGRLTLETSPGKGATFRMWFPSPT